jgi:hypothetical protein
MTDVSERLVIHCPDHEASHYLTAFVADHQAGDGTVCIALRLPTSRLADRRPLIERCVIATLYPLKSSGDPHPAYSVTWLPKGAVRPRNSPVRSPSKRLHATVTSA